MNVELAFPWLLLSIFLPIVSYKLLPRASLNQQSALLFPFTQLLQNIKSEQHMAPNQIIRWLAFIAWILLVIAAARPQWIGESIQIPITGRTLMLAVDISGSMTTEDMIIEGQAVSRLTAVKAVAGEFIDKRKGDYLGLILFGRNAYLQSPLSYDRRTVRILLNEAAVGLAGKETAIGDAIGLSIKRLKDQPAENRILLLLTDGANTAGHVDPLKAADLASQEDIKIYVIGVGDDNARRRGLFGLRMGGSDLDEKTLKAIASKTNGRYFRARDVNELQQIYKLLDDIEAVADDKQSFRPIKELYQWPLATSLLLVIIISLVKRFTHHG